MENQIFLLMMKTGFLPLVGEVYNTYVKNGFTFLHGRLMKFEDDRARLFYHEHEEKNPHFEEICDYMSSGDVYPMIFRGPIKLAREVLGPTNPAKAHEGQIRAIKLIHTDIMRNIAHCSDSEKSAIVEIALTFPEKFGELFPQITKKDFAREYDYIPEKFYPKFTA